MRAPAVARRRRTATSPRSRPAACAGRRPRARGTPRVSGIADANVGAREMARLLLVAASCCSGVVAAILARRLRLPVLVLFLGLGMLLGSDGPGGIYFDDAELARAIGVIGLVAILFEGGLTTEWRSVRRALVPALSLSSVGVDRDSRRRRSLRVWATRPQLVERVAAGRDRRLDGRGCRLRCAPIHRAPPSNREHPRDRVGLQRPDGRRAHHRPHLVDHASRTTGSRTSSCS